MADTNEASLTELALSLASIIVPMVVPGAGGAIAAANVVAQIIDKVRDLAEPVDEATIAALEPKRAELEAAVLAHAERTAQSLD